jgi:GST-like protein
VKETNRLYGVMNKRLADRPYLGGDYSIADMASYPWVVPYQRYGQDLDDFPNLKRWFEAIKARAAVAKVYAAVPASYSKPVTDAERKILFGQTARA